MSQQDHTHWWRDGDASAAPSSLQIGHHQAVVSPVRDECCAGAAGRSRLAEKNRLSKEQRHEPAAWMSRRLVSTAVLTRGMTASARVSEGINRAGYPVREPTRATLVSATWPGGGFVQLCEHVWVEFRGGQKSMKPLQFAASVGLGYGIGDSTRNVPIGIVVPRFLLNYNSLPLSM